MSNKLIIFLIIATFSFSLQADSKFWVKFGKQKVYLRVTGSGFINKDCKNCLAKALIGKSITLSNSKESDFKNPFSVACKKLGAKVRIGKLYSGHSQSFCFMKDESLISSNLIIIK